MVAPGRQRLDHWLFCARVVRTRASAVELVREGGVRIDRARVTQPGHALKVGDVLTIGVAGRVRVLRVRAIAERRGGPVQGAGLYEDLAAGPSDTTSAEVSN